MIFLIVLSRIKKNTLACRFWMIAAVDETNFFSPWMQVTKLLGRKYDACLQLLKRSWVQYDTIIGKDTVQII